MARLLILLYSYSSNYNKKGFPKQFSAKPFVGVVGKENICAKFQKKKQNPDWVGSPRNFIF